MIKFKGLKNFGNWCRKGEIGYVSNQLGEKIKERGYLKIINYVKMHKTGVGIKEMKQRNALLKKYNFPNKQSYSKGLILKFLEKLEDSHWECKENRK